MAIYDTTTGKIKRSYRKWSSMHQRCSNPNHERFCYYGGKGIKVCARWSGKFGYQNFVADLGEPPAGLTLERKNRHKDYEPGNCCWATWKEQAANRDKTGPPINPNSKRQKAIRAGLPYPVVIGRIRSGWSEEDAFNTPVKQAA